ncbi:MAG: alternative ribosome rescue aminoacyl-tRNA hydrolase ArfB [Planctomycetota bacterium]
MDALPITSSVTVPSDELSMRAMRSGGPGGQNVNKVSTGVELRFDVMGSRALSDSQRARVLGRLGPRLVGEGVLIVRSTVHREQGRNLTDARERLAALLRDALKVERRRKATKPTRGSQRRRVDAKKRRGETKRIRRDAGGD